jgi:hypothetical protein
MSRLFPVFVRCVSAEPETLIPAKPTLTIQFFYKHFLSVDLMPFDRRLVKGSTARQNVSADVLNRVEAASFLRRSKKQMDVVRHGRSRLVVRLSGFGRGVIRRRHCFGFSARIRPLFVESQKFLTQSLREEPDLDTRFVQRRVPKHSLVLIRQTVHNTCDLAVD